jgi:hypothetical protein
LAATRTELLDALNSGAWINHIPEYRDSIVRAFLQAHAQRIYTLGRAYFRDVTHELADGETNNIPAPPMAGPWIREHASVMARFRLDGFAPDILDTMRDLGRYLWPAADWSIY